MNHRLYILGIVLYILLLGSIIFYSPIFFHAGNNAFGLHAFVPFYLNLNILAVCGSLVLLRYLFEKGYRQAFYTGLVASIAGLVHAIAVFFGLFTGTISSWVPISFVLALATNIPVGLSFIYSAAGKRPWIKVAGIFILTITLVMAGTTMGSFLMKGSAMGSVLQKVTQWAGLLAYLVLIPYILNFSLELRARTLQKVKSTLQRILISLMGVAGIAAVASTLILGSEVYKEGYWLIQWVKNRPENIRRLAEPFDAHIYYDSKGDSLNYRLLKPLDYDSTKKYPIVVSLHGGSGWGTDNASQVEGSWSAQLLSKDENRKKYPHFLFVPQCAPGTSWGGQTYWPAIDSIVFETIATLEEEFSIDETRRYVMGGSLGGYGAWYFISTRPDMFAAAVPVCGGGDPALASGIVNIPVWAFHGAEDRSVPVTESRNMIEAIKAAGGKPKYTEFPDGGHIIHSEVSNTSDLLDWVFEQKRD